MIWASWSDFWAMGGYAGYVWGSYGLAAVLLIAEIVLVLQRRRSVIERLARMARAEQTKAGVNESTQ